MLAVEASARYEDYRRISMIRVEYLPFVYI